ncbi:MAG: hypothetical protein AVDCRST_MAG28-3402, partial [uncultured Rubrobacteraceae bacterium]
AGRRQVNPGQRRRPGPRGRWRNTSRHPSAAEARPDHRPTGLDRGSRPLAGRGLDPGRRPARAPRGPHPHRLPNRGLHFQHRI